MPERAKVESVQWTPGLPEDRARRLLVLLFHDFGEPPAEGHPDGPALDDRDGPQLTQVVERDIRERAGGAS